jgi:RhoGEF domain/PH domain
MFSATSTDSKTDSRLALLKSHSRTGASIASMSPSSSGTLSRSRSRHSQVNIADITQVRSALQQYTDGMDMHTRFELVVGTSIGPRKGAALIEVDLKASEDESSDEDSSEEDSDPRANSGGLLAGLSMSGVSTVAARSSPPVAASTPTSNAVPSPIATPHIPVHAVAPPGLPGNARRRSSDRRSSRRGAVFRQEDVKEVQRKTHKEQVTQEIQASERLYHHFLTVMQTSFIQPLRERGILSDSEVRAVFANIDQIIPYHKIIADELEVEDEVCYVFRKYAPYLKIYTLYVNNYDHACDVLARFKKNKKFQAFLEEKRNDPECGGLDLMSFLIMPIQRIPRYRLLLQELKKVTSSTDVEHAVLDEALGLIRDIATHVNESKRQAESQSKIIEIQNRIYGEFDNLLEPGRTLVREGAVMLKKRSSKPMHLFLFNDLVLWTTPTYHFAGSYAVQDCDVSHFEHPTKIGFIISTPVSKPLNERTQLIFRCSTEQERKEWVDAFHKAKSMPSSAKLQREASDRLVLPLVAAADASAHAPAEDTAAVAERMRQLHMDNVDDAEIQPIDMTAGR